MHMNTHIQIRNVPGSVHKQLKIRAASRDMTITDYVKQLIVADLDKPTLAELARELRGVPAVKTKVSFADLIRKDRDSH
jgi:plasmid stability protein